MIDQQRSIVIPTAMHLVKLKLNLAAIIIESYKGSLPKNYNGFSVFSVIWRTGYARQSHPVSIHTETKNHFLAHQYYKQPKVSRSWISAGTHNFQNKEKIFS